MIRRAFRAAATRACCQDGCRVVVLSPRTAFTLLELILALALAVVLSVMLGTALTFYVENMQTRDLDVRRVQLATAVMQMISDDLEASLQIEEFDGSALAEFLTGAGLEAMAPGADGEEATSMLFDVEGDSAADPAAGAEPLDLLTGTIVLERPGLIGDQSQIQFDLSRTPRLEEFQPMLAPADPVMGVLEDVPSDLKTVSYFVQPPGVGGVRDPLTDLAADASNPGTMAGGGLVRRQLDRLVTKFAVQSGNMTSLDLTGDILAPEVLAIEFSYFDGFLWQPQWNSDEMGALPIAVQIRLTIGPPGSTAADFATGGQPLSGGALGDTAEGGGEVRQFQQIVRLPMGRIVEEEELVTEPDMSAVGL